MSVESRFGDHRSHTHVCPTVGMTDPQEPPAWLTLEAEEELRWQAQPHKSSLIPALVVGLPLSLVLIGIPIIAAAYFNRENTEYVLTTEALYKKTGILSRDVQRIDFGKVQNTSYSQGVVGSRYGYGNVDISTAGGSGVEMQFRSVPEPRALQERINSRIAARRDDAADDEESPAEVLDDIRAELQAIRMALESREPPVDDNQHR